MAIKKKIIRKLPSLKPKRIIKRDISTIGISHGEEFFGLWLKKLGIEIETQFNIGFKYYDFKVKGKKILIEYDGDFWHANPEEFKKLNAMQRKAKKNDKFKNELARANGYKLIRIWESEFKNQPSQVKEKLLKEILND